MRHLWNSWFHYVKEGDLLLEIDPSDFENKVRELESALKDALASNKGSVIDCIIDIDEMVRPMVSGGAHISDFLLA